MSFYDLFFYYYGKYTFFIANEWGAAAFKCAEQKKQYCCGRF